MLYLPYEHFLILDLEGMGFQNVPFIVTSILYYNKVYSLRPKPIVSVPWLRKEMEFWILYLYDIPKGTSTKY